MWALLSQLLGYEYRWHRQLHIQMHNNYFVFQPRLFTTLAFLPVATVVTSVRMLMGALRHFGPDAVLLMLASLRMLLGLLVAARVVLG